MEKLRGVELLPIDRYLRSASICNTLALLVSQGTAVEFLQRISVLIKLQTCWTNGHDDVKIQCSYDDDSHEELYQLSVNKFVSDGDTIESSIKSETSLSTNTIEPEPEGSLAFSSEQLSAESISDVVTSPFWDADSFQTDNKDVSSLIGFHHRHAVRAEGVRNCTLQNRVPRRRKPKDKALLHICQECGRQFKQRQLLVTHLVTHSGERPYPCRFPGCEKRFGQSSTRNYHERIHSDVRPYVCSQCGLGFKLAPVLRIHMARMHGSDELAHCCDQCGRAFKVAGGLRTHIRTVHSDDRPHACDACPKRFKSRQQLMRHGRDIHSEEKPLHCPVCSRAFTQACNMRTHMRTHTGEKPFVCEICGARFSHSGSLKGHRLNYHKLEISGQMTKSDRDSENVSPCVPPNAVVSTV